MYETRIDIFNKLKDEKRVKDICNTLNKVIKDIIPIEPKFIYYGSKEDGYLTIYNENKHDKGISMDLNFRLHYPSKSSFWYDKEVKGLDDEEFDKHIEDKYNQSKLFCAEISWFSVSPERKGLGTKIVNELIDSLKIIESIEIILLHAKDSNVNLFWLKNKFKDNNSYDKRIESFVCDDMIYEY